MHSPLDGDKMFWPGQLRDTSLFSEESRQVVINFALAYLVMSVLMFVLGFLLKDQEPPINSDAEFEKIS